MAVVVAPSDPLDQAAKQAQRLGHGWIGPEHFVLALLTERSAAGESLRACGLDHESYRRTFEAASNYVRMRSANQPAGGNQVVTADAQEVYARAEGIAAAQGNEAVAPQHVLLSLLWAQSSLVALTLLERLGASRERILDELEQRGLSLAAPLPGRPSWGEWLRLSPSEFERLAARLRRDGVLYRYSEQESEVLISIAEPNSSQRRG
jgi:ATP-dependent Clp protease ATP-binding subunit ClpA